MRKENEEMNSEPKRGVPRRVLAGTMIAVLFLPAMVVGGLFTSYQKSHAQQESARQSFEKARAKSKERADANGVAVQYANADPNVVSGTHIAPRTGYTAFTQTVDPSVDLAGVRPATEVVQQQRTKTVQIPVVDPKTGRVRLETREQIYTVPVVTTTYQRTTSPSSERVTKLVSQLREMKADDEDRENVVEELKRLLSGEFDANHKQQGGEIEKTAKRLESLRAMHSQREENKEQIVQRRIDQLIGQPDMLRWNPLPPSGTTLQRVVPSPTPVYRRQANPFQSFVPAQQHTNSRPRTTTPNAPAIASTAPGIATTNRAADAYVNRSESQPSPRYGYVDSQPRRIEISSAGTSDVFQSARRTSAAALAEKVAVQELSRLKMLLNKNAIPDSQFRKSELEYEQARREAVFAKAEWEAMSERLERELQFAKNALRRAKEKLETASQTYKTGDANRSVVLEAEGMYEKAEKALSDAQALTRQFQQAKSIIGETDPDPKEKDGAKDAESKGI